MTDKTRDRMPFASSIILLAETRALRRRLAEFCNELEDEPPRIDALIRDLDGLANWLYRGVIQ